MLIPGSNDCRLVLDDDAADFIQLSRAEDMNALKRMALTLMPGLAI
jgi:hypothetical protein